MQNRCLLFLIMIDNKYNYSCLLLIHSYSDLSALIFKVFNTPVYVYTATRIVSCFFVCLFYF